LKLPVNVNNISSVKPLYQGDTQNWPSASYTQVPLHILYVSIILHSQVMPAI